MSSWQIHGNRIGVSALATLFVLMCMLGRVNVADAAVTTQLVASGLTSPVYITYAPGDSTRVFIVEQNGRIRILKSGVVSGTPFLDISTQVVFSGERGLLGLAFSPEYATDGCFFINYTRSGDGATTIARYKVSGSPDLADVDSVTVLMTISQPQTNHNGGCLQFGPDGMLYVGMGDGGGAFDQHGTTGNGQNPSTLLGKILRLDVGSGTAGIPIDNPWAGVQPGVDTLDEIWSFGVRNPWRFSFDRATGDLYMADVGQSSREEVDFQPAGSAGGENYGWRCMEGTSCTGWSGCTCFAGGLTDPIHEYNHTDGCSITGGYVYRGCAIPSYQGAYFFGDFCSGRIWSLEYDGSIVSNFTEHTVELDPTNIGFSIVSFGEDYFGELYICDLGGSVCKIVSDTPASCGCSCPFQGDLDGNGFIDSVDSSQQIDIVFFGATDPQDPSCPTTRGDSNDDGFADSIDLSLMIDHVFFGGSAPIDPCTP